MEIWKRFKPNEFTEREQCTSPVLRAFLRGEFAELAENIDRMLCDGRYKSLALTALEEAAMWVNKSIAFDTDEVHVRGERT